MKELDHLLILVTIIITSRADAVPERNRREEDQVPVGGQVGNYGDFSVNLNTEALLSDEIAKGGAGEYQSLQASNGLSFTGLNEAGKSFGAEANAVAGYDGENQFNEGFGYENQLMAGAQASISSEIQPGQKTQNTELVQADATDQSKLQAQFLQGAQYGEKIQAGIKENHGDKLSEFPIVLPPTPGIMQYSYGTTPGSQLNYGLVGSVHRDNLKKIKALKENSMLVPYSKLLNKPGQEPGFLYAVQSNTVPSNPTNIYEGPFVGIPQPDRGNQQSLPVSITGYDLTQSSNWVGPQNLYNNIKNWNLYTKPAEGETLVQVDGEIQSGGKTETNMEVQKNSKQTPNLSPYQNGNPLKVYDNNINWNPYTKPAEGETLVQVDGEIQSGGKTETKTEVQKNSKQTPNLSPYQNGNPLNVYDNNKNWDPYTKPAEGETLVQVDGDIQSGGKKETKMEVQENSKQTPNWGLYQNGNSLNANDNNKNWNPYTKPAEGETLVQVDGDIQSSGKTEADPVVQENGKLNTIWIQNGIPNLSALQKNVVSPNTHNINWNPYTKPSEGETLVKPDTEIQGGGKTYTNTVVQENGKQNNNWVPYQKGNPNKALVQTDVVSSNSYNNNWNPYTKPAEGETFVQPDGEIQNSEKVEATQENSKSQYQKETQANSVVQTSKGLGVTNAAAKTLARYGGHYNSEIQPTSIGQINSENQNERITQTNILVRSNGGFQYSGENKRTDAETQANIAYNRGSPHNWETQYLTAAQIKKDVMNGGAKKNESSLYGNQNKYNGGYLNGEGFQANAERHLKNGAQFDAAVGGNTLVQAGAVIEDRFGQTTSRRPFLVFGHPRNRWHQG